MCGYLYAVHVHSTSKVCLVHMRVWQTLFAWPVPRADICRDLHDTCDCGLRMRMHSMTLSVTKKTLDTTGSFWKPLLHVEVRGVCAGQ
jgi:hypothetical protein